MPTPSGNEKLRTTCDSCAASKVRCSKQKPRCHRCRCLELDCVYGRSQRKGRPPASERSRSASNTRTSPSHMDSVQNLHPSYWGSLHNIFDVSRDYPTASDSDDMNLDDFLNDSDWVSANLIPGTEDRDPKIINCLVDNNIATTKQTHSLPYHNSIPNDSSSDTTDLGLRFSNFNTELCTTNRPDPTNVGSDTSYSDPFCLNKALNTIQELYQLSICHSLLERDINPTTDRVLKTNRQAVQTLESLFSCSCSTCCNDLNMPFLLSTIACKVLGWYKAVYYGDILPPAPSQDSSNQEEIVSMTRITIGDFQLDQGAETRMKAQLLLCELQSFGKVLDVLAQRNRCRSTDVKITESGVHEAFEQFLRGSLDDLVAKLDSCCVGKTL